MKESSRLFVLNIDLFFRSIFELFTHHKQIDGSHTWESIKEAWVRVCTHALPHAESEEEDLLLICTAPRPHTYRKSKVKQLCAL